MPTGTARLTLEAKTRARVAVSYDEIGLASLEVQAFDFPLRVPVSMTADQLSAHITACTAVLERMYDERAIGVETLEAETAKGIDRLEHHANTPRKRRRTGSALPPGTPPADTDPTVLRALALEEVRKVREAKARGDYK